MKTNVLSNANVFSTDWAAADRRASLAKMHKAALPKAATSVWMSDVSGTDRRSVKAWLAGRGDGRVALWNLRVLFGLAKELDPEQLAPITPKGKSSVQRFFSTIKDALGNRPGSMQMKRAHGGA